MSYMKSHSMEIPVAIENFEEANSFIGRRLKRNNISKEIRQETHLIFEALFHSLLAQGFDQNTLLKIKTKKSFGEINIKLGFAGKQFIMAGDDGIAQAPATNNSASAADELALAPAANCLSPEDSILQGFNDKIDHSYLSGYNLITITVHKSFLNTLILSFSAILLAILVYIPISIFMSPDTQIKLGNNIVFPLVKLFSNAMLMVGAPVTFFSLLKNFTDIYILSGRDSEESKLQVKTIITSVIAVLLAIGAGFILAAILNAQLGTISEASGLDPIPSFRELIESLVPPSIFEPFETIMPFPLIFVALIVTYAFCTVGKYFGKMKKAVDACYTLFSRMLHVVMYAFPFFCFLALLYPLLGNGFDVLLSFLYIIALSAASLVILAAFYFVRLLAGGVKLKPFLKPLPKFMKENYKIGSVIDAVPFNVRYCVRNYGMDRKRITSKFTILAQINLDGNCYLIMLIAMLFIFMMVSQASWFHILVIAIMVVFLSFGAPNQPGSILIGTLIIALFLKADALIPTAVILEAFFGAVQNLINVTGDVVTVAIEEKQYMSTQA